MFTFDPDTVTFQDIIAAASQRFADVFKERYGIQATLEDVEPQIDAYAKSVLNDYPLDAYISDYVRSPVDDEDPAVIAKLKGMYDYVDHWAEVCG